MRTISVWLALLITTMAGMQQSMAQTPTVAGCQVFPADNIWNTPVDTLPISLLSTTYINTIGATTKVHPSFGSGVYPLVTGGPIGIPWIDVPGNQAPITVSFDYDDESDAGPYPIPSNPPVEGVPAGTTPQDVDGDRHILIVDRDNCKLYELFHVSRNLDGSWGAGSGAIFDLNSNALRPDTWTSADAAGLPILPGLIRYDEVAAGVINHAIRFTVPQTRRAYVWPARHFASSLTGSQYPPMGARFRLRADFPISSYDTEIQVIMTALKKYGMMLSDNGSAWFLIGEPDERWNNDMLRQLKDIVGSDFELVDVSSMQDSVNSGKVKTVIDPDPDPEPGPGLDCFILKNGQSTFPLCD